MYTEFFGLTEKPFSITPDPRYLYLSQRHADALAHLIYGISESGGFIQLTGEVGTGKTTLIRSLLEQLPEQAEIALILNPQHSTTEFLAGICQELRLEPPAGDSVKAIVDRLNTYLLGAHAEGRRVVLIIDEAQNLGTELLEQVRLLTNLETARQKLLQIILIGQPELRDLLARSEMRQIAQRVTGRYHLQPLSREDAAAYVRHRMRVAGSQVDVFTPSALREIYKRTNGIPRLINVVADRSLLAAYTRDSLQIEARLVRKAAAEVFGAGVSPSWMRRWRTAAGVAVLAAAGVSASLYLEPSERQAPEVVAGALEATLAAANALAGHPAGEAPSLRSLTELLSDPVVSWDTESAVSTLFALWDADYDAGAGSPCEQASTQQLRCLYQDQGSIGQLRRLDRPAILSLTDRQGNIRQVVVSGLGRDHAELAINGKAVRIGLSDLTHYWFGDHLLLWRPHVEPPRNLMPGMRDEAILWLRESLARIQGEMTGDPGSSHYDAELERRVRAYQQERRLTVDGIVGPKTQIALGADLDDPKAPRLSKDE